MTQTEPPTSSTARALWYVDRGVVALHDEQLAPRTKSTEVLIRTLYSAISRGTERLVYLGAVPETEWQSMRCPMQVGTFPFPVKYGYCAVGIVDEGPTDAVGHVAFCLHPHQDRFVAPLSTIQLIPKKIPARRATLAANMETALNAHWDAGTAPGDRVIVIGGGIVGLLTAYIATRIPGTDVTLVDISESRRTIANRLNIPFATAKNAPDGADIVFHASATANGLQSAIDAAAMEARIIEVSWYGAKEVGIGLGGAFHSKRLQIISSQVGHIAPKQRPRWSFQRRLAKAVTLLDDAALDALIPADIPFHEAERHLPAVFSDDAAALPPVIRYPAAGQ